MIQYTLSLASILILGVTLIVAQTIPRVECGLFTPSYCEMYCGFAQVDHEIGLEFPSAEDLIRWFCNEPSASDLLTCWGCDQTGIDTSKTLLPGTTPGTNATYQKILYDWSHVCDSYWVGGSDAAEDTIMQSFNSYPDGYSCKSSGVFTKDGLDVTSGTNGTGTGGTGGTGANGGLSVGADTTTSFSLHAGGPDVPTQTSNTGPSSSRPLVNGDPPTSSTALRAGGEGGGPGEDGAGVPGASLSIGVFFVFTGMAFGAMLL